jgi:hypothetical protein
LATIVRTVISFWYYHHHLALNTKHESFPGQDLDPITLGEGESAPPDAYSHSHFLTLLPSQKQKLFVNTFLFLVSSSSIVALSGNPGIAKFQEQAVSSTVASWELLGDLGCLFWDRL